MIDLALKARIPLIHVRTTDTVNVSKIIRHISGAPEVARWDGDLSAVPDNSINYVIGDPWVATKQTPACSEAPPEAVNSNLASKQSVLVIVNAEKVHDLVFDAGELPTPRELKRAVLTDELKIEEVEAEGLLSAMGGLTLTESDWALRLTHANQGSLSRVGIARTRKKVFPPKPGLEQVDTDEGLYIAPPMLSSWLSKEAPFFMKEPDVRLRPKGILFGGPPGTGKTAGAKHIARELGLPLFRFDSAEVKSKWVGESESNLKRTLQAAAHEAPCVLLLDEVEKMFNTGFMDGTGVTQNLLGDFLWFLQENEARVLVVMTTNAKKNIPAPLIRKGRIDRHMDMLGLPPGEIYAFAVAVLASYGMEPGEAFGKITAQLCHQAEETGHVPQADVEHEVITFVKLAKSLAAESEAKSKTPKPKKGFKLKSNN